MSDDKPYRLKDGEIVDAEGRRITISGLAAVVQLLNERDQLKRALDKQIELASAPSAIDAMPKQLTMSPEVVEIVERLSKLPPFAWPAWDARVLLGFCVLHAAHATVSAPTDGKGQP